MPNPKTFWLTVKVASVLYTVVIPMLNPLIYSLQNKDMKNTFRKLAVTKFLVTHYNIVIFIILFPKILSFTVLATDCQ